MGAGPSGEVGGLVEDLEAELDDARFEGAGDLSAARAEAAPWVPLMPARQVEVGVVEEVVELCPELHVEALDGGDEFLVHARGPSR